MAFDTALLKSDICDWADEVEREFSVAGTEDKFSQCSQDTWLYYSTSSSLPFEDVRLKTRDRSDGRGKSNSKTKQRQPKGSKSVRHSQEKPTASETLDKKEDTGTARATVMAMIQSRQRDFASCAASHAWASNFEEHKKKHQTKNVTKSVAPAKPVNKEKQRKVVCHQVMDGAVLVVTRKAKAPVKAPTTTPIKNTKKLKKLTPPSPTPSRSSRADSSRDWKSDKRSMLDSDAYSFQISSNASKSKRASRSLNEERNKQSDARKKIW